MHAFFLRMPAGRAHQIAAGATAGTMAAVVWQLLTKETDYPAAQLAPIAHKLRALERQIKDAPGRH